jgi:biotin carboxyl carrier protein
VALALGVVGCGHGSGSGADPAASASVAVQVRSLETRTFAPIVVAQGRWRSTGEVHVMAPFAAIVESLTPRVGDRVARGQAIGVLVTRESQAAVRGSELLLRQAPDAAAREEARRALALARHDLVRVPLVAGGSGTVSVRLAEPGAQVSEGAELLTLVPSGALVFEAHVPLAEAARVAAGQRATIAMEDAATLAATVQTRVPTTSATDQTVLVWLAPVTPVAPELIDRFGGASIETGAGHRAVAAPDSAVVEDDLTGERRVAVVEPSGIAVWKTVRLGLAQKGWHELLEPALPAGTRVVIVGQRGLPDSTQVRIGP